MCVVAACRDLWLLRVQVVQLQQTITEAEDKVQQLELCERRLKERVAELQRSAEVRADVTLLNRFPCSEGDACPSHGMLMGCSLSRPVSRA